MIAVLDCQYYDTYQHDMLEVTTIKSIHETLDDAKKFISETLRKPLEFYRWVEFSIGDTDGVFVWDKANELGE